MIGVLITLLATLFSESSTSIGKYEVKKGEEGVFSFAFINLFFILIFFIAWAVIIPSSFVFSTASLPTFLTRAVLEIIQTYVAVLAITKADRTTFSFFRIITIPLLLLVDIIMGYSLETKQIIGISILFIGVLIALIDRSVNKKHAGLILYTAVGSVATISLYKYNISHFNSFVAEQLLLTIIVLTAVFIFALVKEHSNPLKLLLKRNLFAQSFLQGAAGLIESFAYTFTAASVVVAVARSGGVVWSTIFGRAYFKEKHIAHKIIIVAIIITGFFFLI